MHSSACATATFYRIRESLFMHSLRTLSDFARKSCMAPNRHYPITP
jgi:hypothetical protein